MEGLNRFVSDGFISFDRSDASLIRQALNEKYLECCQFAQENGFDPRCVPVTIHMKAILDSLDKLLYRR